MITLISVVVTTYNRSDIVGETILSILNQTYQNFELIVVDDGSTDNTEESIKFFKDKRIQYIKTDNWGGPARPRNIGIKHAKGEYIAFCDDDDIWMRNKLDVQMIKIEETQCDLVSSNTLYFENTISNIVGKSKNRKIKNFGDLIAENQINTSTVLVRNTKDLFFKEDKNLIAIEDYALWLELFIKGMSFEFISEPLAFYRIGQNNITKKNWDTNHLKVIYLHISILIQNPELKIKINVLFKIILNFFKFFVKNTFFK